MHILRSNETIEALFLLLLCSPGMRIRMRNKGAFVNQLFSEYF